MPAVCPGAAGPGRGVRIVLFHSAHGLTPGVADLCDALRAAGHDAHTPDLFDGRVFPHLEDGLAFHDALGAGEVADRAARAVAGLPSDVLYAGLCVGCRPARILASTVACARGAVLVQPASVPRRPWPAGIALDVHTDPGDPRPDHSAFARWAAQGGGAVHLYPGRAAALRHAVDDGLVARMLHLADRLRPPGRAPATPRPGPPH